MKTIKWQYDRKNIVSKTPYLAMNQRTHRRQSDVHSHTCATCYTSLMNCVLKRSANGPIATHHFQHNSLCRFHYVENAERKMCSSHDFVSRLINGSPPPPTHTKARSTEPTKQYDIPHMGRAFAHVLIRHWCNTLCRRNGVVQQGSPRVDWCGSRDISF